MPTGNLARYRRLTRQLAPTEQITVLYVFCHYLGPVALKTPVKFISSLTYIVVRTPSNLFALQVSDPAVARIFGWLEFAGQENEMTDHQKQGVEFAGLENDGLEQENL